MAISQTPASLPVGVLVNDRFRVKKLLGYGGYGNVYLVEDEVVFPGNQYALKESLSTTTSERRQFSRESKWLTTLRHPNLPRVTEEFEWNSRLYFVMAYVAGENLEDRVDRLGPLPEDQVLGWILPICDAVAYLHSQKRPIIHRDIKPGNIIVTKDGRPWLVDFGIAKVLQPGPSRKTTRAARAVSGGYSPLEQYTRGGTDVRSDVYALGATLYHLLTGVCPPEAPDIASGVARLPEPRQIHSRISKQTEQAVMKAMRQKPEERIQTVRELMDALPGGVGFVNTTSTPLTQSAPTGKARRGKAAANAAAPAAQPAPVPTPAPAAVPYQPSAALPMQSAGTFIGPPAAALPYQPPAASYAAGMPAAGPIPGQPVPAGSPGAASQPQALPAAPAGKLPKRRRRVVLAGLVALLCGLLVLGSIILAAAYWGAASAPAYVTRYDTLPSTPLWLPIVLSLVPLAGLALMVLPIFNWFLLLGRGFTYALLLLLSLAGLAATITWAVVGGSTAASDVAARLFQQGFYIPILLFGLAFLTTAAQIIRRK
jgi:predicted Ser/Thr protein kinase